MEKLLLISNGFFEGKTYLEYARNWMRKHFDSSPQSSKTLLFVPYAKKDHDAYVDLAGDGLAPAGITLISTHTLESPVAFLKNPQSIDGIFVAGGNGFRLLDALRKTELLPAIREKGVSGTPYLGVSAGTNVAGPTIMTTNDMPITWPKNLEALGFVPFQINTHYVAGKFYYYEDGRRVPYNGETRDDRIAEYHEENDLPVVAHRVAHTSHCW
jgi:dipeptidase E